MFFFEGEDELINQVISLMDKGKQINSVIGGRGERGKTGEIEEGGISPYSLLLYFPHSFFIDFYRLPVLRQKIDYYTSLHCCKIF